MLDSSLIKLHSFIEISKAFVSRLTAEFEAFEDDVSSVTDMLNAGMPVDSIDEFGFTTLWHAAENNRTDVTRVLLLMGANVNKRNGRTGTTALHAASSNNSTDVIRVLMQHGASATVEDIFSNTPIDYARIKNYEEAVRIMEQH